MEKYSIDYWKEQDVKILDEKPEGWIKLDGSTTAPNGYEWYSNGKSRFDGKYDHALVNEETSKYQVLGDGGDYDF